MARNADELRESFDACDTNGNGSLQFDEFVTMLDGLEAGMSDAELRIGFAEIDADHDGRIDFEEFFGWWSDR